MSGIEARVERRATADAAGAEPRSGTRFRLDGARDPLARIVRMPVAEPSRQGIGESTETDRAALLDEKLVRIYRRCGSAAAIVAAATGVIALFGWFAGIPLLTSLHSGWVPIKANTALCLVLAALAALADRDRSRAQAAVAWCCAGLVALTGLATATEYLFGADLGIDELVIADPGATASGWPPGRMSPQATVSYALLGLALLARLGSRNAAAFTPLTLLALFGAVLSLVGYLLQAEEFYTLVSGTSPISFPAGAGFLLLGSGLLLIEQRGTVLRRLASPRAGGAMLRRLLPLTLALPVLIVWVRLQGVASGWFADSELASAFVAVSNVTLLAVVLFWAAGKLERSDIARLHSEVHRAAAEYARSLLEASLDPLVAISPEGKITDVNSATERATGFGRATLIGTDFADYFTEPEKARTGYREAFGKGSISDYPLSIRHVSGRTTEVMYNASVYRTASGAVAGVFAAARDVSRLRRAETARDQLARVVEHAQEAIFSKSLDGIVTSWNEGAERLYGYTAAEMIGQPIDILAPPERRAEVLQLIRRVGEGEVVDRYETVRIAKSGERHYVSVCLSPIRDDSGTIVAVSGLALDITEQRRIEEALRLSEERYRTLVVATAQIVWVTLADGKVIGDMPLWRAFTGQSVDELQGDGWSKALHPDDRTRTLEIWSRAVAARELYDTEYRIRRHDGEYRHVAVRGVPVLNADGSIREWVGTCTDITERKRAEAEVDKYRQGLERMVNERTAALSAANEKLEAANKELEGFSYSVSHDLRTPLRAIDGFSRILLEDYADKLDAEGQRVLNVVRDSTMKMSHLIDDILAFSRAGRTELKPLAVDMEAVVRDTLADTLAPALAGRTVAIDIGKLPAAHGDRAMLARVWTNLLDNAIKFTAPKADARIEIGANPAEGETVYWVRDNGVGFDMQYAGKLFGVFQRLHGVEIPGTGIGLAIVKRIVTRHGGRVWADGKVDQGATFYFALPNPNSANKEQADE